MRATGLGTLAKTVTYRAVSLTVTTLMAYGLTGSWSLASACGLLNLTVNSTVYFAFERVWAALVAPRFA